MQAQVIVPLDGSTLAETILPHALFFARHTQSVLTLLRVIMPPGEPEYASPYIPDDWFEGEVSWTKSYLNSVAARLQAQGVTVQARHVEGTFAWAAIQSYAEQHPDVQLIALATHGRDAGGRLLLGSVARDVYASAPTSLLLLVSVLPTHLLEEEIVVDEIVEPLQKAPADEEKNQQHQLIVTTREQAEHKVMRFLHRSNVPVLFVDCIVFSTCINTADQTSTTCYFMTR
jgi:nucleotide-binding universal stress UspA family protein